MGEINVPEPECPEYKALMEEYCEKAYPLLEQLKVHIRNCEECRRYLLQSRDTLALYMLGISDSDLEERMKT